MNKRAKYLGKMWQMLREKKKKVEVVAGIFLFTIIAIYLFLIFTTPPSFNVDEDMFKSKVYSGLRDFTVEGERVISYLSLDWIKEKLRESVPPQNKVANIQEGIKLGTSIEVTVERADGTIEKYYG